MCNRRVFPTVVLVALCFAGSDRKPVIPFARDANRVRIPASGRLYCCRFEAPRV
jgi:hypothetical protein